MLELFTGAMSSGSGDILLNKVTVARTPEETAKGLMNRHTPLANDEGMIFDYGSEVKSRDHAFWMRNTYIPLGILFTDADMRVLNSIPDMKPLNETPRQASVPTWRYAIEVAPNTALRAKLGERVILPFDGTVYTEL
jgi:uncharacterized membrane protein (UPF0127 family)